MTEPRVTARAYQLRRDVVSDRGRREAAQWVGLSTLAVALYLALVGVWIAAGACLAASAGLFWLGGVWVLPWSRDGYLRRLSNAETTRAVEARRSSGVLARQRSKFRAAIARLSAPPELPEDHDRILKLVDDRERRRHDRSLPLEERAREALSALAAVGELTRRLSAEASTDAQRRYVADLDTLLAEYHAEYATATGRIDRAGEEMVRTIGRMRVPPAAREQHVAVVAAYTAFSQSMRELHAAFGAWEDSRAQPAVRQVELARDDLRAATTALADRLDYASRWPAPPPLADDD